MQQKEQKTKTEEKIVFTNSFASQKTSIGENKEQNILRKENNKAEMKVKDLKKQEKCETKNSLIDKPSYNEITKEESKHLISLKSTQDETKESIQEKPQSAQPNTELPYSMIKLEPAQPNTELPYSKIKLEPAPLKKSDKVKIVYASQEEEKQQKFDTKIKSFKMTKVITIIYDFMILEFTYKKTSFSLFLELNLLGMILKFFYVIFVKDAEK